jgi:hypothetical protein
MNSGNSTDVLDKEEHTTTIKKKLRGTSTDSDRIKGSLPSKVAITDGQSLK